MDIGKEVKEAGGEPKEAGEGEPKPKLRLRRLKIVQFRNVDPCELHFGDGFNVLLGVNGSGKTTLLNLIAAVLTDDFTGYRGEAFELEYELALDSVAVVISIRHRPGKPLMNEHIAPMISSEPDIFIEVLLRTPAGEWRATLHGSKLTVQGQLKASSFDARDMLRFPRFFMLVSHPVNESTPLDSIESNMPIIFNFLSRSACRFDEGLDYFRTLTASGNESGDALKFQVFRNGIVIPTNMAFLFPELTVLLGRPIREQLQQGKEPPRMVSLRADQLSFLQQAIGLMGFRQAELQTLLLSTKTDSLLGNIYEYSNFRFLFTRIDGSIIPHDYLSFGQKRLLAFLYYLAGNRDIAVADELMNGMHHEWIEACIKELKLRQSFLAGQNPMLFDYIEFQSPEDVIHSFVQCERVVRDQREFLRFSNMSEYDAASVFSAYEVGIQHVSEILRTKGLW